MALCQAPPLPLLGSKHSICHYKIMNVETWIRNQILNKNLMLTFFFSFVNDYLLLNFGYRAQCFLEGHLWLGETRVDWLSEKVKVTSFTFPLLQAGLLLFPRLCRREGKPPKRNLNSYEGSIRPWQRPKETTKLAHKCTVSNKNVMMIIIMHLLNSRNALNLKMYAFCYSYLPDGWDVRLFVFPSNWHVVFTAWWLPTITIPLTFEVSVAQGRGLIPLRYGPSSILQWNEYGTNMFTKPTGFLFPVSPKKNICLSLRSEEFASQPRDHAKKWLPTLHLLLIQKSL